jgi:hypothetical protein
LALAAYTERWCKPISYNTYFALTYNWTSLNLKITVFWDITLVACWKSTDVSEEHFASIFRVE